MFRNLIFVFCIFSLNHLLSQIDYDNFKSDNKTIVYDQIFHNQSFDEIIKEENRISYSNITKFKFKDGSSILNRKDTTKVSYYGVNYLSLEKYNYFIFLEIQNNELFKKYTYSIVVLNKDMSHKFSTLLYESTNNIEYSIDTDWVSILFENGLWLYDNYCKIGYYLMPINKENDVMSKIDTIFSKEALYMTGLYRDNSLKYNYIFRESIKRDLNKLTNFDSTFFNQSKTIFPVKYLFNNPKLNSILINSFNLSFDKYRLGYVNSYFLKKNYYLLKMDRIDANCSYDTINQSSHLFLVEMDDYDNLIKVEEIAKYVTNDKKIIEYKEARIKIRFNKLIVY